MKPNRTRKLLAVALVGALASCAGGRKTYRDQQMEFGSIHTVAVLPLQNLSKESNAADRVRETFAGALLSTGVVYVLPLGEVARSISRLGIVNAATPAVEDITKLGKALQADAVVTGVVREYGETRSGTATGNLVSVSLQLYETQSGKVVWSAAATRGGVTLGNRLFGGSGPPLNELTEQTVEALLDKLFQ
jgi:hypothetical protein